MSIEATEAKREIKALKERVEKLEGIVADLVKIMLAAHGATPPVKENGIVTPAKRIDIR